MAHSDKQILITPNVGSTTADPKIVFSGANATTGPQNITVTVYHVNGGTLSFDGSAGQLFSITNSLTGTIYSVNDISGIPSIEVLDTGLVKLAQYSGNVVIGSAIDNGTDKLQVSGSINTTDIKVSGNSVAYSDIRLKKNIQHIGNALDKVSKLNGYTYDRTDIDLKQTGIIAQELLEVLPEAVVIDDAGYYSVAYGNVIGLLIESIKELKDEVNELRTLVK